MLGQDKLKAFIISQSGASKSKPAITNAPIQIVNDTKSQKS